MAHATARRAAPSASTLLRARLDLARPALDAVTARLWQTDGLAERYRVYLEVMYDVTRSSVPLMLRAAALCAHAPDGDPVAVPLRRYLEAHAREESGHDDWLREDLELLGAAPDREAPPPAVVARLVGPQYYWLEHYHPVTVLGYIAVMEATAPRSGVPGRIAACAEVPDAALRTLREHVELDAGHTDAVLRLLDALPLSDGQARAVALSGLHTAHGLIALYEHILRTAHVWKDTR
ncbi:iron-containing redox enzyme family protein [Actinospica durhamensis]|uniref:Iron-containing redox enzyme family protein n=1 Tax=Actinospica durhamensis TaxID=1508375 RepID=A0A941ISW6_9ACTN|nr:iron-containing redox enzyme family protein [Actinospica durhamensis]MBR7839009.1 iron-containing redox enzyme family protein [Actinospica durhamensis]